MNNLRRGKTLSCGCQRNKKIGDAIRTHGATGTRLYGIWAAMKRRCDSPSVPAFRDYGGRGIRVCQRWLDSFENFAADVGVRPMGTSLDRIDNDGDYEPKNCRWSSRSGQARNTRIVRLVVWGGVQMPLVEVCEITGVPATTVRARIKKGWPESRWFLPKGSRRA